VWLLWLVSQDKKVRKDGKISLKNYSPITKYKYAIIAHEIITNNTANHSLNNNQVVTAKIRIMAPISVSPVLAPIYSLITV
jgi:hypothetical protein